MFFYLSSYPVIFSAVNAGHDGQCAWTPSYHESPSSGCKTLPIHTIISLQPIGNNYVNNMVYSSFLVISLERRIVLFIFHMNNANFWMFIHLSVCTWSCNKWILDESRLWNCQIICDDFWTKINPSNNVCNFMEMVRFVLETK